MTQLRKNKKKIGHKKKKEKRLRERKKDRPPEKEK
jgi:hypothetical protein